MAGFYFNTLTQKQHPTDKDSPSTQLSESYFINVKNFLTLVAVKELFTGLYRLFQRRKILLYLPFITWFVRISFFSVALGK